MAPEDVHAFVHGHKLMMPWREALEWACAWSFAFYDGSIDPKECGVLMALALGCDEMAYTEKQNKQIIAAGLEGLNAAMGPL